MKKWLCLLFTGALTFSLSACRHNQNVVTSSDVTEETKTTSNVTDTSLHISPSDATEETQTNKQEQMYSSEPYITFSDVDMQGEQFFTVAILDTVDWEAVVNKIPATYYEEYPNLYDEPYLNGEPLTATLCKNGKVEELSVYDPRVVRLVNFYHNALHYTTYASGWTGLNNEHIEENEKAGFKLVLAYPPEKGTTQATHYTVTIYNREIIGIHCSTDDSVNIGGVVHVPFHTPYNWLTVFGF